MNNSFERKIVTNEMTGQIRELPDYKFFEVNELTTMMCSNCNKESFRTIDMPFTTLNVYAHEKFVF